MERGKDGKSAKLMAGWLDCRGKQKKGKPIKGRVIEKRMRKGRVEPRKPWGEWDCWKEERVGGNRKRRRREEGYWDRGWGGVWRGLDDWNDSDRMERGQKDGDGRTATESGWRDVECERERERGQAQGWGWEACTAHSQETVLYLLSLAVAMTTSMAAAVTALSPLSHPLPAPLSLFFWFFFLSSPLLLLSFLSLSVFWLLSLSRFCLLLSPHIASLSVCPTTTNSKTEEETVVLHLLKPRVCLCLCLCDGCMFVLLQDSKLETINMVAAPKTTKHSGTFPCWSFCCWKKTLRDRAPPFH